MSKRCPACGSLNAEEWEKCVICGISLQSPQQEALWWKVVAIHPATGRRLEPRPFSKREYAKIHAERLKALGYEARYFPMPYGIDPNQELKLVEKPYTWEAVAAWLEAEGSFYVMANRKLIAHITIVQKDRVLSGYKILKQIRDFIDAELGTKGIIYEYAKRPHMLRWSRHLDSYKITAAILPYMHHPEKIRRAINMLSTIETWKKKHAQRLRAEIPRRKGRALSPILRHLRETERDITEIQKIKEEYPYLKTLY